jgi:riboflavin biosynthesis pyrimidine reductase
VAGDVAAYGAAVRKLFPDAVTDVDPVSVYADLPHNEARPSVRLNMIVSVDGGTSWGGVSGALGGPADKALFSVLRSFADVVLVAAGTMRAERYGPAQMSEAMQEVRRTRGQAPIPNIAVVSRSCQMDWQTPFFTAAVARPLVITVAAASAIDRTAAAAVADVIVAGEHDVDLAAALDDLAARGARDVLAEGGPSLNGDLAHADLLDELCVTLSPRLASGDAKRIISGSTLNELQPLELWSICEEDNYLFLRYRPVR